MIENHMVLPYADDDQGEPGYCHSHSAAFTDYCQFCDEERRADYIDACREDEQLATLREKGL